MKTYKQFIGEARQLKDPKTEVLVVKDKKVVVIDKKDLAAKKKEGWVIAESTKIEKQLKKPGASLS